MAWFKVDDGFYRSAKVLSIPRDVRAEALGAWIIVGTWAADNMVDGVVPKPVLEDMPLSVQAIEALVKVGLWIDEGDSIRFHDWCDYQPTREQLQEKAKGRMERARQAGQRSGEARRTKRELNANESATKVNPEPEPEPEPITTKVVIYKPSFDEFWQLWPRKESKANALKAWEKALRKVEPDEIIAGARRLVDSPYRPEIRFIPHAATWLNAERWTDPAPEIPASHVTAARRNLDTVAYFEALEAGNLALEVPASFSPNGLG